MFCAWIVLGVGLLQLRWSTLYSEVAAGTWAVLGVAFLAFWLLSRTRPVPARAPGALGIEVPTLVGIGAYFALAVVVNHGVPVLLVLAGARYDVYGFGIKGLHVLVLSFTGYYGVRAFNGYLRNRDRKSLIGFLMILVILGSIANRGAISFLVFSCIYLVLRTKRVRPTRAVALVVVALSFLYLFGQFGNARLSQQITQATGQAGGSTAIADLSRPSPAFVSTGLPASWLWPYMYMSSPTANLNSAVQYNEGSVCGARCDLAGLVLYQLIPDNVGKRIAGVVGVDELDTSPFLIRPDLTVSTTFGNAIGYAGYVGAGAVLVVLLLITRFFSRRVRGTLLQEEGLALLACLLFFSFFDDMVSYAPASLQLVWVLVRLRSHARYL